MAVLVRNGYKNYGSTPVLENISLTVRPGSIYGLLGASGCGKTTLLSCIVGLKTLDSGEIQVLGCRLGEKGNGIHGNMTGYMPQEVALYPFFTIAEILAFYGRIYGMSYDEIETRTQFLAKFLQLPNVSTIVETLSGGESRRISLSCALIHQPDLLILDEPTVGLDPLLRESIWEHMTKLAREDNTTIIITTHYIEESRSCDMVGIMRRGRLLAEQNPETLMGLHDSISLETVLLKLCKEDEENYSRFVSKPFTPTFSSSVVSKFDHDLCTGVEIRNIRRLPSIPTNNNNSPLRIGRLRGKSSFNSFIQHNFIHHTNIVFAIVKKNFLLQLRHPLSIIAHIFIPILQTCIYNMIMGTEPFGQNVAYVSNDWNMWNKSSVDQTLIDFCSNEYKSTSMNGTQACFKNEMSAICTFLNQFDADDVTWIPTSSVQDSLKLVHRGDAIGFIEFPANLTNHFRDRGMFRNFASNETIDGSTLKLRMDLSDALVGSWLTSKMLKNYLGYVKETVTSCGHDPALVTLPLKFNAIYGELEGHKWIRFMQPALIITAMFILSNLPGVVWVMEKRMGITDRGTVVGVKFGHIVGASLLSDTILMLCQIGIMMFMLLAFYDMRVEGSMVLAVTLVFMVSLAGLSLGFLCASICEHEMSLIAILMFINSMLLISTGGIWPLEAVVKWYRIFCLSLPISLPIASMRAILFRNWGIDHPIVLQGFLVSWGWIVVGLGISGFINYRKK